MSKVDEMLYAKNPMRSRTAPKAWLTQFVKGWEQRTGRSVNGLKQDTYRALVSQGHSLYQVGFTAKRAAWMAAPLPWESGARGVPEGAIAGAQVPNPLLMVMTNPGGAAQGKLYSMKLGLYPSDNTNLQNLIATGKFASLKARAIQMGYSPVQSKTGHPWPGTYFMSKAGDVLVLETVPPSHMMFPIEESECSPEEQALRKKYVGKNPGAAEHEREYGTWREHRRRTEKDAQKILESGVDAAEMEKLTEYARGQEDAHSRSAHLARQRGLKNPGAAWHTARVHDAIVNLSRAKTKESRDYQTGRKHAEEDAAQESRFKGMKNPAKTKRSIPRNKGAAWGQLVPLTQYKTKRWVVTVPYESGKKKTFLFSAPDAAAAKKKLMDMWFEGKFAWKGEQPTRAGWAVREVGKKK